MTSLIRRQRPGPALGCRLNLTHFSNGVYGDCAVSGRQSHNARNHRTGYPHTGHGASLERQESPVDDRCCHLADSQCTQSRLDVRVIGVAILVERARATLAVIDQAFDLLEPQLGCGGEGGVRRHLSCCHRNPSLRQRDLEGTFSSSLALAVPLDRPHDSVVVTKLRPCHVALSLGPTRNLPVAAQRERRPRHGLDLLVLLVDPAHDVLTSVTNILPYAPTRRAVALRSPRVQGLHGDLQISRHVPSRPQRRRLR